MNILFMIGSGILGLIIGSFLNVVIYRLPIMLDNEYKKECLNCLFPMFNLAVPGSFCPQCNAAIKWWQNIPLVSFLILKGRCGNCNQTISWRYPTVELLSMLTTIWVAVHFGLQPKTLPILILTWTLIVAIFIDFERQLLPDHLTLPLMWLGLLLNTNNLFTTPQNAIIGAVSGYLFLWTIAKIFKLIRNIDGMGYGDFKLFAVFGAWLGWQALPLIITVASISGLLVGMTLILNKKLKFSSPIPFGPYLATAGWLALFWGS